MCSLFAGLNRLWLQIQELERLGNHKKLYFQSPNVKQSRRMENIKDVKFFQGLPVAIAVMKRQIEAMILLLMLTFLAPPHKLDLASPNLT